tara:strand:- start:1623 stop:2420 length:798 start_codon:yes stop_codon:yes gene_type:complete
MSSASNTYNYDKFGAFEKQHEQERLNRQAALAHQYDLPFIKSAGISDNHTILDLGCGPGHIAYMFATEFPKTHVHAIDSSSELLNVATNHYSAPNLFFKQASVYDIPYDDHSFDIVYCRLVFQHLSSLGDAIQEIYRVLKPGGKVCIVEIDDSLQIFSPIIPSLEQCRSVIKDGVHHGGNRYVGREIPPLLLASLFQDINIHTPSISTVNTDTKLLFDIALSFIPDMASNPDGITAEVIWKDIHRHQDAFFGLIVLLCMQATKPY